MPVITSTDYDLYSVQKFDDRLNYGAYASQYIDRFSHPQDNLRTYYNVRIADHTIPKK